MTLDADDSWKLLTPRLLWPSLPQVAFAAIGEYGIDTKLVADFLLVADGRAAELESE
jgi:hypothetical protein